jgi:CDP-2,3-bis-(O-geranylgeranyl)-sn-glycerol synthase
MIKDILFAIWFFLPAGLANASPLYAQNIPGLRSLGFPLDFNKKNKGKIIFGKNKTWRGLILAIIIGIIFCFVQHILFIHSTWIRSISGPINYSSINYALLGALLGSGAILGDAVESFIKRRNDIRPGSSWFPYDQIDFIIGGCLLALFVVKLSFTNYVLILVVWFFINILASYIGYLIGLKERPI